MTQIGQKTSKDVENFIAKQNAIIQYNPPYIHCQNSAERAIQKIKNNLVAGLASLTKSFPIENWCKITKQANDTLNMMRPYLQNPYLSAFEALEGM